MSDAARYSHGANEQAEGVRQSVRKLNAAILRLIVASCREVLPNLDEATAHNVDARLNLIDALIAQPAAENRREEWHRISNSEEALRGIQIELKRADQGNDRFAAQQDVLSAAISVRSSWAASLYAKMAPPARLVKAILQMLIGIYAAGLLVLKIGKGVSEHPLFCDFNPVYTDPAKSKIANAAQLCFPAADDVLSLIAIALASAAVIELAYTLFTDGPDEALDPLLLGLAAAMLLQLGNLHDFSLGQGGAIVLYALGLLVLFFVRKVFIAETDVLIYRHNWLHPLWKAVKQRDDTVS